MVVLRLNKARKRAIVLKQQRLVLVRESCARKIQVFFSHINRKLMLSQNLWRIKVSRVNVRKMREKRLKLRQEGAALMLQCAWRIKQSRKRARVLKAEKVRLSQPKHLSSRFRRLFFARQRQSNCNAGFVE
jgi:hypothetical protein